MFEIRCNTLRTYTITTNLFVYSGTCMLVFKGNYYAFMSNLVMGRVSVCFHDHVFLRMVAHESKCLKFSVTRSVLTRSRQICLCTVARGCLCLGNYCAFAYGST